LIPSIDYLTELAVEAGGLIKRNFRLRKTAEWKGDGTPLTQTDQRINDLVLQRLHDDFPDTSIIGEEGREVVENSEVTVYFDPVDGTDPFLIGVPISTFCLAVVSSGQPIKSVIYDPFLGRLWYAQKDQGAFLNGERIIVSEHPDIKRAHFAIIWWNGAPYRLDQVLSRLIEGGGRWFNPCSVGLCGGLIASGQLEASFFPNQAFLETAAMQLLVEEAGGRATDLLGNPLSYDSPETKIQGHLISNGCFHDQLVEIVRHLNPI
jgi:myo-inositol-1(or 4)-monophosphatase